MAHAPDLVINSRTFGRIPISDVTEIACGWGENLELANQFIANRNVAPNPRLIDYVKEFQDSINLAEWNNLSLKEKVQNWSNLCKKDLINLRRSTNYHVNKYS
jgi:hypothetical protein